MDYLPLFLDVAGRHCLLVGGGDVAWRKARLLARAGARLRVVAPSVNDNLQELLKGGVHELRREPFRQTDLDGVILAIAATDDEVLNAEVSRLAQAANIPVNVVDERSLCTMIFPAVVDRSPVLVAISSGGSSPVLVRKIKEQVETMLPGTTGQLARLLGSFRSRVKSGIDSFARRVRFWESVLDSDVPERVHRGDMEGASERIEALLTEGESAALQGEVYLVGAGPGDPDLLTLKALRLMLQADVVLYDRLVSEPILAKIRPDAEMIHVGKQRSTHLVPQDTINEMLVNLARQGKRVLRLKGGDPFIFGRGGEEMASLIDEGIPFQVVPGITAASGCASYAGIPLTHRDHAHSVVFLTGHFRKEEQEPNWPLLVQEGQTLVFYMGLMNLDTICRRLIDHGMPADKPAALVQKGTTDQHAVITAQLGDLAARVEEADISAPTLVIVGDVVRLRDKLDWYRPPQA